MFKLTRRQWMGTAFGGALYGLPGCGKPAATPDGAGAPEAKAGVSADADRAPDAPSAHVPLFELVTCPGDVALARAVNASGHLVGQLVSPQKRGHACLWGPGVTGAQELGASDSPWSCAYSINGQGQVVGEFEDEHQRLHAFEWRDGSLTALETMGGSESHALCVNDEGLIAGYETDTHRPSRALLWHSARSKPVALKPLDGLPQAQALAVNAAGMAAGSSFGAGAGRAVVWESPEHPLGLPLPSSAGSPAPRTPSIALAINEHAHVAGSYGGTATLYPRACRWTGSRLQDMRCEDLHDDRLGVTSQATSLNKDGMVVGTYMTGKGEDRAFLHSRGEMKDLTGLVKDPRGLVARYAKMIDDRGWIVGLATRGSDPRPLAFVARPIDIAPGPTPGAAVTTAAGWARARGTLPGRKVVLKH